jgi:hypothetical protein
VRHAVQVPEERHGVVERPVDLLRVADVDRERPAVGERGGHRLRARDVQVEHGDGGSGVAEHTADRGPDPRRATRDDVLLGRVAHRGQLPR